MSELYDVIPSGEPCKAHKLADLLESTYKRDEIGAVRAINHNRGNYLSMRKFEGASPGMPDPKTWGAGIEMCDGSFISIIWTNGFLTTRWHLLKQLLPLEGIEDEQNQRKQQLTVRPRV